VNESPPARAVRLTQARSGTRRRRLPLPSSASVLTLFLTLTLTLACACACLPAAARAARPAQTVRLTATLTPEHLGEGTTIGFNLRILTTRGKLPPPLTEVDLRYPENLGIATSGLGLATCATALLEAAGPQGCPSDSVMGIGSAVAEIPVGPEIVSETAPVTIFRAPTENGQIAMVLYANGATPVDAQILLPSLLLPATAPFGGRVKIHVPLVPSLPDSPDVAVVRLTTTLGPLGITYYEREHGRTVAYRPRGLQLPGICPHRGFPFAAQLDFVGGSSATARAVVPCPGSPPPHSDRS
jgi:hypothetical protein